MINRRNMLRMVAASPLLTVINPEINESIIREIKGKKVVISYLKKEDKIKYSDILESKHPIEVMVIKNNCKTTHKFAVNGSVGVLEDDCKVLIPFLSMVIKC